MRLDIAKDRISEVLRPDTMTTSTGDFLATHVPLDNIELYSKYDPSDTNKAVRYNNSGAVSEDAIFNKFVLNEKDEHQFILVIGESGAGKSHLIRWFNTCLENKKKENEIILFIRRNDNTLKGTIKQLLKKTEIENISNKETYERLLKASAVVSEDKLKSEIISKLTYEITANREDTILSNMEKRNLSAFMKYANIDARFKDIDGPIDRIYLKIAESNKVINDVNAMFEEVDFENIIEDVDLCEDINLHADRGTKALLHSILDDKDKIQNIVKYLNSLLDIVIQECSGLQQGDFEAIFNEIRRNIKKQGKALTILIEDITSFTGVNIELLNALTTEHTGVENEDLCRISSIIGITSGYFKDVFKTNYRDRTTLFVNLKNNIFSDEYLYEFVAKYLNVMSISKEEIEEWVNKGAYKETYPIHKIEEGINWECVEINGDKKLNLYPFTRNAIKNLYNYRLETEQLKTPRYILQYIVEPIVKDLIIGNVPFPNTKELKVYNKNPSTLLRNSIFGMQSITNEEKERLFLFMSLWGDGSDCIQSRDGEQYISGISEKIYKELKLPILTNLQTVSINENIKDHNKVAKPVNTQEVNNKSEPANIVNPEIIKIDNMLEAWINGDYINVGSTNGTNIHFSRARDAIIKYLSSAINWQIEGISLDNKKKIDDSRYKLIGFERQNKGLDTALVVLKADRTTQRVIEAFVRWEIEGNGSWNFKYGNYYALVVETWTEQIKKRIVDSLSKLRGSNANINYYKFAIASEMYRQLLFGQIKGKWNYYKSSAFIENKECPISNNSHCKEWNKLQELMSKKQDLGGGNGENARLTALDYFNLIQGKGGSKYYFDRINFDNVFNEIRKDQLKLKEAENEDFIPNRDELRKYYNSISARIETVYKNEKKIVEDKIIQLEALLGSKTISLEEIVEIVKFAENFYGEAADAKLYIQYPDKMINKIKRNKSNIAEAIDVVNKILETQDMLDAMILMSQDPVSHINIFCEFLEQIKRDISNIDNQICKKMNEMSQNAGYSFDDPYQTEKFTIQKCNKILDELR